MMCHLVACGSRSTRRLRCARQSSSVRVGPHEGSMTWEVDHFEVDEPCQRPMPEILKLAVQDMTRLHRQVSMFALHRLHSGYLVLADGTPCSHRRFTREGGHLTALFFRELWGRSRSRRIL